VSTDPFPDGSLDGIAARLVGSWRLVRWAMVHADAALGTTFPYGADADGLLVYTADGWMSGAIARANRPPFSIGTLRSAPEQERLDACSGYFHYASRYHLRQGPAGPQVVHEVLLALDPGTAGTAQVRDVAFGADGTLHLTANERSARGPSQRHQRHPRQQQLQWRRWAPGAGER
jgi:hypothetical protein